MIDLTGLEKIIRSVGVPAGNSGSSKKPVYEVRCQECGGAIRSDNLSEVEYIQTRRGTEMFFHTRCLKRGKADAPET